MDTDALQRLDGFLSDPRVPQEDKNRAVAMARTQEGAGDQSTALGRAGQYAKGQVERFGSAMGRLGMDVASQRAIDQAVQAGAEPPDPNRTWGQTGLDVLTVGGPVAAGAPLTLAGTAAGAGMRAFGADESTADLANAVTQLAGGLYGAGKSALGVRGAVGKQYGQLRTAAATKGYTIPAGSQLGTDLVSDLETINSSPQALPQDQKTAQWLMKKLYHKTLPSSGQVIAQGPGATYADLEEALNGFNTDRDVGRWGHATVKAAMMKMLAGTPEAAGRQAADITYRSLATPLFKS